MGTKNRELEIKPLRLVIFIKLMKPIALENPLASRELRIFLEGNFQNPCFYLAQLWIQSINQKRF